MADLEKLKRQIMNVIRDNNYDIDDLKDLLSPVSEYVESDVFKTNIEDIVAIVTKDRDGNNVFTIDDLALLKNDIMGITSLVTALLLLVGAIPELKLKYDEGATEEIIFKLLSYVFLVVVPKQTGKELTNEEKESILNITLAIYQIIKSSQITKDLVNKIVAWFKSKGLCACVSSPDYKESVVEKRLPKVKLELSHSMNNVREKAAMKSEIKGLQRKLEKKSKK
ncbi:hypothetical protein QKU48_gp0379 [Fadolivirus algeromassiliense]|uniref:Uncharacterized protein n=1 Tax=Fadolivirus FV1/VV64 TaxID=3070911 RepID=A0A7D3V8P0_9VIRU|nr:hypothetical protein QKU48_gp0379 [Fadolivirus algeromassiliense]QKF93837.1 hypothetical protein Fadolivirus_1_379 [Fadolivirus FV1/VV64]